MLDAKCTNLYDTVRNASNNPVIFNLKYPDGVSTEE